MQTETSTQEWLIVGAKSTIGQALSHRLRLIQAEMLLSSRTPGKHLSIDVRDKLYRVPRARGSNDVAVILVAESNQQKCEDDPRGTRMINVDGVQRLCDALWDAGWHVLYLSSDAVYPKSHLPTDDSIRESPRNEYGRQKLLSERHVLEHPSLGSVLRLSKVIDPHRNPWKAWATKLRNGATIEAFTDNFIAPMAIKDAADAIIRVGKMQQKDLWQASGAFCSSYFDFMSEVAAEISMETKVAPQSVGLSIPIGEIPFHMSADKLMKETGWAPSSRRQLVLDVALAVSNSGR